MVNSQNAQPVGRVQKCGHVLWGIFALWIALISVKKVNINKGCTLPKKLRHQGWRSVMLPLYGLTPFTLQDFPNHTACIVWFGGCNMRCKYCHNPEIVLCGKGAYSVQDLLSFLNKRAGKLDGVVFTGGEATTYPDLQPLAQQIKALGFKLKLDTNGLRPTVVEQMLKSNLLDYIALDYKAPPYKFKQVTGVDKYSKFSTTLNILCSQKQVGFEVRTTVHTDLLNNADVQWIMDDLQQRNYTGIYYVQNYKHTESLGNMNEQKQTLDVNILKLPNQFSVEFRNYA